MVVDAIVQPEDLRERARPALRARYASKRRRVAGQAQRDPARVADARRALLERLIDHAALFPPASLGMDAALEVDRWARATPEAWMLHRFLVPASKLAERARRLRCRRSA